MTGRRPCLWACSLALVVPAAADAADARTVSLYDVGRAGSPPAIDGRLDDACWREKPVITNMVLRDAKTRVPAKVQTRTTVLYDDQALYVGIRMDEPHPAGLRKEYVKYDGALWWDDSVELYIETGSSHREYFKFMSNPIGTRFDARGKLTPMGFEFLDWGTGTEWTVRPHVGEDFWSLEFRFPWTDLEVEPPQSGELWSFEVVRFRYADGWKTKEYSAWNVGTSYSRPERFGNIVFSGTSEELETMLVEKLKPVFGGSMKIYGREGEIRYTDYQTLKAGKVAEIAERLRPLRARFEGLQKLLPTKAAADLEKRIAEVEKRLAGLKDREAGPAVAEALDKLLASCERVDWTLRYHELNESIPAAQRG